MTAMTAMVRFDLAAMKVAFYGLAAIFVITLGVALFAPETLEAVNFLTRPVVIVVAIVGGLQWFRLHETAHTDRMLLTFPLTRRQLLSGHFLAGLLMLAYALVLWVIPNLLAGTLDGRDVWMLAVGGSFALVFMQAMLVRFGNNATLVLVYAPLLIGSAGLVAVRVGMDLEVLLQLLRYPWVLTSLALAASAGLWGWALRIYERKDV